LPSVIILLMSIVFTNPLLGSETEPPTLREVMRGLEKSLKKLDHGIFFEDFKLIKKSAMEIAIHPKPLGELPKILKKLGKRAPSFKGFDLKVHNAAKEMAELASKKDMFGILNKHSIMLKNCVGCHLQYRIEIASLLNN